MLDLRDFFMRWMVDCAGIDSESRMPKYSQSNGKTALTDVLGGDARRQFEAMWQFLRTR